MATKTKSGLPSGVSVVANRPGLFRLTCMVRGKRYSEYYRPVETGKKKLQSERQKVVDAFRERVENGQLESGDINDKSTFAQAVEWFTEVRKLDNYAHSFAERRTAAMDIVGDSFAQLVSHPISLQLIESDE